jgi:pimeloyl-ACP methyl ester carboxylesterase
MKHNAAMRAAVDRDSHSSSSDATAGDADDDHRPAPSASSPSAPGSPNLAAPALDATARAAVVRATKTTSLLITTKAGTFTVTVHQPPAVMQPAKRPLLLMLHGFPDLPEPSFAPLSARLVAAGYNVAVPHLRGYESPTVQAGCTRTEYFGCDLGLDVLELIAVLRARQFCSPGVGVILVGHDWGSVAAQQATSILFEAHYEEAARRRAAGLPMEGPLPDGAVDTGAASETAIVNTLPKSILRGTVLIAVPPLQHFAYAALWLFPVQLIYSWYMFFFVLPWLPEWAVRTTGLVAWLWRSWSPTMAPTQASRRGEAVRDHLNANGRPLGVAGPQKELERMAGAEAPYVSTSRSSKSSHGSSVVAAIGYYRSMFNLFNAKARYSLFVAMSNDHEYLAARALPTLAINGDKDGCIHPKVFKYCSESTRHLHGWGVEHYVVEGTGHWPHLEDADDTAEAMLSFFRKRKIDGPRRPPAKPKQEQQQQQQQRSQGEL